MFSSHHFLPDCCLKIYEKKCFYPINGFLSINSLKNCISIVDRGPLPPCVSIRIHRFEFVMALRLQRIQIPRLSAKVRHKALVLLSQVVVQSAENPCQTCSYNILFLRYFTCKKLDVQKIKWPTIYSKIKYCKFSIFWIPRKNLPSFKEDQVGYGLEWAHSKSP